MDVDVPTVKWKATWYFRAKRRSPRSPWRKRGERELKKIYRKARGRENRRNYSETTDVCVTACLAKSISEWYAWILYRLVSAQSSDSLNLNAKYCISIRLSRKWDSIFCPSVFRDHDTERGIERWPIPSRSFGISDFIPAVEFWQREPSHWNSLIAGKKFSARKFSRLELLSVLSLNFIFVGSSKCLRVHSHTRNGNWVTKYNSTRTFLIEFSTE
mgnify:CR=1 FL=1